MISLLVDGKKAKATVVFFSDGGINVDIGIAELQGAERNIRFSVDPSVNICATGFIIQLAADVINANISKEIHRTLYLPYLPHARADRPFTDGMTSPFKIFIEGLRLGEHWDSLETNDIHNANAIPGELLHYVSEIPQSTCMQITMSRDVGLSELVEKRNSVTLCAPDNGAYSKASEIASKYRSPLITLDKKRNPINGWIESISVSGNDKSINGEEILIVDDICDGGATFVKSAELLKNMGASSVSLYVTHGIFSKGLRVFDGIVDNIYCMHLVGSFVTSQEIHNFNRK